MLWLAPSVQRHEATSQEGAMKFHLCLLIVPLVCLFVGSVVCGHHDVHCQSDGPQVGSIAAGDEGPRRAHRSHRHLPPGSWEQLDDVNARDVFLKRIPMLKSCHQFLRGRLREGFGFALRERLRAKHEGDVVGESRAWKLFALLPMMLLHRPRRARKEGRRIHTRQVDAVDQRSSATRVDIWQQRFQRA